MILFAGLSRTAVEQPLPIVVNNAVTHIHRPAKSLVRLWAPSSRADKGEHGVCCFKQQRSTSLRRFVALADAARFFERFHAI